MSIISLNHEVQLSTEEILNDYRIACESRAASALARKEVYSGKAKFGVFGTGKEMAQICMAKYFQFGDFRSGYYRDQTFQMAIGELTIQQYFAQLYAHTDVEADPSSAGRMMIGHYATRSLDENGLWKDITKIKNATPDISPTGAQMPRAVGLAFASKLYRQNPDLQYMRTFSRNGNEISWATIGNGACAEGIFFEAINAAGVLQVPMITSIWDDAYAISVTQDLQTTKLNISALFDGFRRTSQERGIEIVKVNGWNYKELCLSYYYAAHIAREQHIPVLMHVDELTQPFGHSTSGSHERYKTKERLQWEEEYDCNKQFRKWILESEIATEATLVAIETKATLDTKIAREKAWDEFLQSIKSEIDEAKEHLQAAINQSSHSSEITEISNTLQAILHPIHSDTIRAVKKTLRLLRNENIPARQSLQNWMAGSSIRNKDRYNSHLYSQSPDSPLLVPIVPATFDPDAAMVDGREVIQHNFEALMRKDARVFALGEDVGQIGDVNQGFAGLQDKFGKLRVMDTGIRESTIIGQGIGAALRGLKPIAEIQYLDYIYFCIQTLSDDLSSMHYRSKGAMKAPMIIRTRGHRLEGMFHSGSPISMILGAIRGIYFCVPRNLTQAAGMYNLLVKGDNPALIIEPLNAYRLKEKLPNNLGDFTVPLGQPDILRIGSDVTVVTYGSMCRIVLEAARQLSEIGIEVEVIDVQTLLPYDLTGTIIESIKKTNKVVFADEDVQGGASAYMMQQTLDLGDAWRYLDAKPRCVSAQDHRPAYGTDGDYFSKPSVEDTIDTIYSIMHEIAPDTFPELYR